MIKEDIAVVVKIVVDQVVPGPDVVEDKEVAKVTN